jgi:hypothetical protein
MAAPAIVVKMPAIPTFIRENDVPESGSTMRTALIAAIFLIGLSGCDIVKQRMGIVDPVEKAAQADADGRAVGGACRQSGRAIEDCYSIYSWLPKASIYEGWRDMDAYMRDNKLETVEPQLPPVAPPTTAKKKATTTKEDVAANESKTTPDTKATTAQH